MIDLKKEILDRTRGGLDILLDLFPDARSVIDGTARKFKMRPEERTASATIRQKDGVWYVCDFGDDGREINCFDAYMKANNIAFSRRQSTNWQTGTAYNSCLTRR